MEMINLRMIIRPTNVDTTWLEGVFQVVEQPVAGCKTADKEDRLNSPCLMSSRSRND